MLIRFVPIFVADTKIIYSYNFAVPLKIQILPHFPGQINAVSMLIQNVNTELTRHTNVG